MKGLGQIDFDFATGWEDICFKNGPIVSLGFFTDVVVPRYKRIGDKLHAAGLAVGLHTFAAFIDKRCPWITPVPDPRLATAATFTLREPLTPESDVVAVAESTEGLSAVIGYFASAG